MVPVAERPGWLERGWERVREEVGKGRQAYVVVSRIGDEASESETSSLVELQEELVGGALHGLRVGALHGRMAPDEKDAAMNAFAAGEIDVLVATTVVEVGVDVPNATVMVIMDADRFGMSQLQPARPSGTRGACGAVPARHRRRGRLPGARAARRGGLDDRRIRAVAARRRASSRG
ncbi:helicase-related protein [Aeromicrobium sp. UC242_57]|uniref:helicase-related protein n=1 Tax=Aeromicrobium sp. UC242_57 TaxID=3374624 RepID=UPI0037AD9F55